MDLQRVLESIGGLNTESVAKAQARLDNLTKPLGSLGRLEDIVKQVTGITGNVFPKVDRKTVVIMCADNGVYDEGVSSCPKSVTASVTCNFLKGFTGINVLTRHAGAEILVVDIGVDEDIAEEGILDRKIRKGTWNITKGPAMTREEALRAIETGIEIVGSLKGKGVNVLGTGEMGICNTTTSSAITAVLTDNPLEELVGKGSGLTREGLDNKIKVVKKAIEVNKPDPSDPMDVLVKVGGFDIAGLVGCFIGAAVHRVPILIDGFISAAAALVAIRMNPQIKDFVLPSHGSAEPGSKAIMKAIGFEPYLNLGMRLGEGTGTAIAFHIIDAAFEAYTRMGTFGDAKIEQYVPLD